MSTVLRTTLLLFAIQAQALADTQSITVDVGGESLNMPAPAGFHEISQLSPEAVAFVEKMIPPSNRLLAVFVSESDLGRVMKGDLAEFKRYMLLQVYRQDEQKAVSEAEFVRLANTLKQQQDTLSEKVKGKAHSVMADQSRDISKSYDVPTDIKLGEIALLGVFMDKSSAVGCAALAKVQTTIEGRTQDNLLAYGTNLIRVKSKVVSANVYGDYESQTDLEWVRATSSTWADQILTANPPRSWLLDVPDKVIVMALVPVALAIIGAIKRFKKHAATDRQTVK